MFIRHLLLLEDEAKVRFHNKPPPPNGLINPLTTAPYCSVSSQSHQKKILLPPQRGSSGPAIPRLLFLPLFLIYLCLFFFFFMKLTVPLSSLLMLQ